MFSDNDHSKPLHLALPGQVYSLHGQVRTREKDNEKRRTRDFRPFYHSSLWKDRFKAGVFLLNNFLMEVSQNSIKKYK